MKFIKPLSNVSLADDHILHLAVFLSFCLTWYTIFLSTDYLCLLRRTDGEREPLDPFFFRGKSTFTVDQMYWRDLGNRGGHRDLEKKFYFFFAPIRKAHEYFLNLRREHSTIKMKHAPALPKLGLL